MWVIDDEGLEVLFTALRARGFSVLGPTLREQAIVYGELGSAADLPVGWTEIQDAGRYRLARRQDQARFGYTLGPTSWKSLLFPPALRLWQAQRTRSGPGGGGSVALLEEQQAAPRYAFIGVRACELRAIELQDRVFLQGDFVDVHYRERREATLLIAVNCGQAAPTCFCVSMGSGPHASAGFDLALTEVLEGGLPWYLLVCGSARGEELAAGLPRRVATGQQLAAAEAVSARAAGQMGRELDTAGLPELLLGSPEHPQWDRVAERCLTCANCTLVCPTCFCTTVEDTSDLTGQHAERWRRWDSCFTRDYSYIHGGHIRISSRARYRQWLTHKLAGWHEQFGSSGCVGCGRCITWCPVGIDLTAEVRALQAEQEPLGQTE